MITDDRFDTLDPEQLRQEMRALLAEVARKDEIIEQQRREALLKQATIDKLTHEMAVLKRMKFAARSEAFNAEQRSLLEEALDEDLAALAREIEQ
ncbi:transposase, partial [Caldimonas tepidiphila]|uniref:transposase n=1 Tax=Caldimonas tepidiphila TaxID=2315841 RepID=UPI00196ABDC5